MRLYHNRSLSALVIYSQGHALVLRCSGLPDACFIEFDSQDDLPPLEDFVELTAGKSIYGFIGLFKTKKDIYLGFITNRKLVAQLNSNQGVYQILDTIFVSLSTGEINSYHNNSNSSSYYNSSEDLATYSSVEAPAFVHSIVKLFASGTFYYSLETDLSVSMKDKVAESNHSTERFVWNDGFMDNIREFRSRLTDERKSIFDSRAFYIKIIRGYVNQRIIQNGKVIIISRQDNKRNGSLFGPFGMDDDGNVANFVQTEISFTLNDKIYNYSLLGGNVPMFWKLDSHLISTKLDFKKYSLDSTFHSFFKFFDSLVNQYGDILVLDALSGRGSQPELSERFQTLFEMLKLDSPEMPVKYKKLLPANHSKPPSESYYQSIIDDQACVTELSDHNALVYNTKTNEVLNKQRGCIFVASLFSIERSTFLKSKISEFYLQKLVPDLPDDLWFAHYELWQANSSALVKLADDYNQSLKSKNKTGGIIGKFAEQGKRISNSVGGNGNSTKNSGKQRQIDKLLKGRNKDFEVELIDPINDYIMKGLNDRYNEYTQMKDLTIYNLTFNVNGIKYKGDLDKLLFPEEEYRKYDLVVIGLQEVIELTPSKVMNIDPEIKNHWELKILSTLNSSASKSYSLLKTEQLGGVLMMIFSHNEHIDTINNIETCVKKTGFKGMSKNKGGVSISFTYAQKTKFAFVVSHLAAGHHNLLERHQDYKTIFKGIKFSKNKSLVDCDIVFWMGDLNYRLQLPNDLVRKMLNAKPRPPLHLSVAPTQDDNNDPEHQVEMTRAGSSSGAAGSISTELQQLEPCTTPEQPPFRPKVLRRLSSKAIQQEIEVSAAMVHKLEISEDEDDQIDCDAATEDGEDEEEADEYDESGIVKDETVISTLLNETKDVQTAIVKLFEYDQLNSQMKSGKTFPFFDEMEITFKPTYKFDKGTDYYDSSEKKRIPSWTDRILARIRNKQILTPISYNSIPEYRFSDHKPVYGIFEVHLEILDEEKKNQIEAQLYFYRKSKLGNESILTKSNKELDEEGKIGGNVLKHGLPPPSGKLNRWWRETVDINMNKSKIVFKELESNPDLIINPKLPLNPFLRSNEVDFIELSDATKGT